MTDHAAVATALAGLDRAAMVEQRWFGAKGRAIQRVDLDAAFVLDDGTWVDPDLGGRGRFVLTGLGFTPVFTWPCLVTECCRATAYDKMP